MLRENKRPNGIVPTLKSFFGSVDHGACVAWKLVEIEDTTGKHPVSRLPLPAGQVREFYDITSKDAFWPNIHSLKERYNHDPLDWPNVRQVN
ncbi:hypothetical protein [Citreimonas salinaria]|uniref:Glucosylglycerol-phosphate synthase n=1 Tax=Citreimonas salinaria TaxID=321339 RepID=A0A1H3F3H1_9RHOB|nr:glucosylglycerol-phosphate synthase [Citreimonas salinaria]